MNENLTQMSQHYRVVADAIEYIRQHLSQQPRLEELASAVNLSPFHFQRVFAQWAGISPKRFIQVLTKEHAKFLLSQGYGTLDATYALGLSSPSRLHDLLVSCEAMTPGEMKAQGRGQRIGYGYAESPFGTALLGWTSRGICHLSFVDHATLVEGGFDLEKRSASLHALSEFKRTSPEALLEEDPPQAEKLVVDIFGHFNRRPRQAVTTITERPIHLVLRGTNFQVKVWEALLRLGDRPVVSYQQLAYSIGHPTAQRAVAQALASNHIGWLIPCHRVIRQQGEFGHYRWGETRKQAMLAWEMTRSSSI